MNSASGGLGRTRRDGGLREASAVAGEALATVAPALRGVLPDAETRVPGSQDRLRPIRDLELGEDRGQMVGDGLRRQAETARDLGVRHSRSEQGEDFPFPHSQLGKGISRRRRSCEEAQHPLHNAGSEDRFA
jgi:hypothetical protein